MHSSVSTCLTPMNPLGDLWRLEARLSSSCTTIRCLHVFGGAAALFFLAMPLPGA